MKLLIINHDDSRGGASIVSTRLLEAFTSLGVDARMLVVGKSGGNDRVEQLAPQWRSRVAFLADTAANLIANRLNRNGLFKIDTARFGRDIASHPLVGWADVVMLGWVNQGMMSVAGIKHVARLKPVIWTMHDFWPMTGLCHLPGGCTRFEGRCGCCPKLRGPHLCCDASRRGWQRKHRVYGAAGITFVAVSSWLGDHARRSGLLGEQRIEVIPNPFPLDDFQLRPTLTRDELGLPQGRLIVMGAARLDDANKNLPLAVDALNLIATDSAYSDVSAVLYGEVRDPQALAALRMPYTAPGIITDRRRLNAIYSHATAVLSTSYTETLGGTLVEGQAAGCYPVATARDGRADVITDPSEGCITGEFTPEAVARGLRRALDNHPGRALLRGAVERKFASEVVARRYLALAEELLAAR